MNLSRRGFLGAMLAAAPAIIRTPGLLMPIKPKLIQPPITSRVLYSNRTIRQWMDVKAIRDRNVLLCMEEYAGFPVTHFRNIPILVTT